MARRSRMSMLKRQRELKKSEKAARKRAKRHGVRQDGFTEPRPTAGLGELLSGLPSSLEQDSDHEDESDNDPRG